MARLKNGILGGMTGIIGPIESYILRGQSVVRSRRQKSNKPLSARRQASLGRMKTVTNFLHPRLTEVISIGFADAATGKIQNANNLASSYLYKNAVSGEYPDYQIDYPNVRFTEGPISTQGINAAVVKEENQLRFSWTPYLTWPRNSDHVILIAWAPSLNDAVYTLCGARRDACTDVLKLPDATWNRTAIEVYIAFKAENSMVCSNSIYLGQII
jgi:hypothetical protein